MAFIARARELGLEPRVYIAEGEGHGSFNFGRELPKTTRMMDEFLQASGLLAPDPVVPLPEISFGERRMRLLETYYQSESD